MIIYLFILFFLLLFPITENSNKNRRKTYIIFAFIILCGIAALRKYTVGFDLRELYSQDFESIAHTAWGKLDKFRYEIGYCIFCKLIGFISVEPQCLIICTSIITNYAICRFIYKNSKDLKLSICIFVCFNIYFMYMNVLRQALALSIIMLGMNFLKEKKYIKFTLIVLLASTFHTSAILCLFFIVINSIRFKKKDIILSVIAYAISLLFYNKIFSITASALGKYDGYVDKISQNGSFFSLYSFLNIGILILACIFIYYELIYKQKNNEVNKEISKVEFSNSLIMQFSFYALIFQSTVLTMNILSRMKHYFFFMLLIGMPEALKNVSTKNKKIVKIITYSILLSFFIWTLVKTSAVQFGTVPYEFFWEDRYY